MGVTFGAVGIGISEGVPEASLGATVALTIGMELQNLPEDTAVAMPLRRERMRLGKSFFYGQLSAVVKPVAAVVGAAAVILATPILPYALAFAAGAMISVIAEELVPEAKRGSPDIAAMTLMVGFAVMMTLDVALGVSRVLNLSAKDRVFVAAASLGLPAGSRQAEMLARSPIYFRRFEGSGPEKGFRARGGVVGLIRLL